MKLRMLSSRRGAVDETGNRVRMFEAGEVYAVGVDLPASVANVFVREGWAEVLRQQSAAPEAKPAAAPETKPARGRRTKRGD